MDWQIQESSVHFKSDSAGHLGSIHSLPEQNVLYRPPSLSVATQCCQVVLPWGVLEVYRDLNQVSDYELETAGEL